MNWFDKFLDKIYKWRVSVHQKRQKNVKLDEKEEKRKEIYKNMRFLYQFVNWLNKEGLPNRSARKAFWHRVSHGEPVLEQTVDNFIEKYKPIKVEEDSDCKCNGVCNKNAK